MALINWSLNWISQPIPLELQLSHHIIKIDQKGFDFREKWRQSWNDQEEKIDLPKINDSSHT